jgi:lysophospholipase L1-like esterase
MWYQAQYADSRGWWRWVRWGGAVACGAAAVACFFLTAWIAVTCRPWAWGVYAENPYAHAAGGLAFLGAAWMLGDGYRRPRIVWVRGAGRVALLAAGLVFAWGAGEILLRAILIRQQEAQSLDRLRHLRDANRKLPVRSSHPMAYIIEPSDNGRLVYELRPGLDMEFGRKTLRTNRDGLRADREFAPGRKPGVVRVVTLGDSGMFGWNVNQGEEYPAVLQRVLDARGGGAQYEVINLAVPGYNTQLEVERLRARGLAYAPDVVVVGWCENDYQLPFFMLAKENFRRRDVSYLHLLLFDRPRFADAVTGIHFQDQRAFDAQGVTEELRAGAGAEGVRRALQDLKGLAETNGFRAIVFGPLRSNDIALVEAVGLPHYSTRRRIRSEDYPTEWAVHHMHPRPEGHRVLAEHLAEELAERGWLEPHGRLAGDEGEARDRTL